jgi:hypothetical protein
MASEQVKSFSLPTKNAAGKINFYEKRTKMFEFLTHKSSGYPIRLDEIQMNYLCKQFEHLYPKFKEIATSENPPSAQEFVSIPISKTDKNRVFLKLATYESKPFIALRNFFKANETDNWFPSKGGNVLHEVNPKELSRWVANCLQQTNQKNHLQTEVEEVFYDLDQTKRVKKHLTPHHFF